jgi:hypothetical protein
MHHHEKRLAVAKHFVGHLLEKHMAATKCFLVHLREKCLATTMHLSVHLLIVITYEIKMCWRTYNAFVAIFSSLSS